MIIILNGGESKLDREKAYNMIKQTRKKLDDSILINKKRLIIEKIQELGLDINFSEYLKEETHLYIAPIHQFFKGKLINYPTETGNEIYIDEEFSADKKNQDIILHELTHELLHSLCRLRKNKNIEQYFRYDWFDQNKIFIGIDEATT